jgi:hypothetical protein
MHTGVTRLRDHALIAQQAAQLRIGQHLRHRGGGAIEDHALLRQPNALAVIHPCGGVPKIERLDGRAIGPMPAVNGHLAGRAGQLRANHNVLLVSGYQRAQRMGAQGFQPLCPHHVVVQREDGHGGHSRAGGNGQRT